MGLFFGRYGLYFEFEDGESGYFMEVYKGRGGERDCIFVTKDWDSAEKYMSESGASSAFDRISHLKGVGCCSIVYACIVKDREPISSKLRRM